MFPIDGKLARIKSQCIEEGTCWVWGGYTNRYGHPVIRHEGNAQSGRRVVMELAGRWVEARKPIKTICDTRVCLNPLHLEQSTMKEIAGHFATKGAYGGALKGAKIAAGIREKSNRVKLTPEDVAAIRDSKLTQLATAKKFGICRTNVRNIQSGKIHKDYSNPWAGLFNVKQKA